jgi:hypothetical protein
VRKGSSHSFDIVGSIDDRASPSPFKNLGSTTELSEILVREKIDIRLADHLNFSPAQLAQITDCGDPHYVEWEIMPAAFPIFLSGLRRQTVGSIPVIGVEDLAISRLLNRIVIKLDKF